MMASRAEQVISRSLRMVLADLPGGASIPGSDRFREVITGLQYFLPEVLGELHREWTFQGLDDVLPVVSLKTGEGEADMSGLCCFVSDQTLTPIHLKLQVAATEDEISWLECRLGERGPHGMVRTPYHSLNAARKRLYPLEGRVETIEWVYSVAFGQRRT